MILHMINNITVAFLKELFIRKYSNDIFFTSTPEVRVTLTVPQYRELNNDLMRMTSDNMILLTDDPEKQVDQNSLPVYTKITITNLCEFIIELGEKFTFEVVESEDYGDEEL